MPIEPPVVSPRDLAGAYAALAGRPPARPSRPIAGGTDLMVALTGELGEPPASVVDLWGIEALRGIAHRWRRLVLGRPDDVHRDPPLAALSRARRRHSSRPRRPSGRRRSRTAARSAATSRTPRPPATRCRSCSPPTPGSCWAPCAGSARSRRRRSGPPIGRRRWPRTNCCCGSASRSGPGASMRFRKVGTRRAQSISKVVMAVAWRDGTDGAPGGHDGLARRPGRPRVRGGHPDPRARARRPSWRARRRPRRSPIAPPRPSPRSSSPIDDVRSTAEYRRLVAARILHRIVREAGGW